MAYSATHVATSRASMPPLLPLPPDLVDSPKVDVEYPGQGMDSQYDQPWYAPQPQPVNTSYRPTPPTSTPAAPIKVEGTQFYQSQHPVQLPAQPQQVQYLNGFVVPPQPPYYQPQQQISQQPTHKNPVSQPQPQYVALPVQQVQLPPSHQSMQQTPPNSQPEFPQPVVLPPNVPSELPLVNFAPSYVLPPDYKLTHSLEKTKQMVEEVQQQYKRTNALQVKKDQLTRTLAELREQYSQEYIRSIALRTEADILKQWLDINHNMIRQSPSLSAQLLAASCAASILQQQQQEQEEGDENDQEGTAT